MFFSWGNSYSGLEITSFFCKMKVLSNKCLKNKSCHAIAGYSNKSYFGLILAHIQCVMKETR